MAHEFTLQKIFDIQLANGICDSIYYHLAKAFPPTDEDPSNDRIYKGVLLSGRVAAILQEEPAQPIENIVFVMADDEVFAWLQANASSFLKGTSVKLKGRLLCYVGKIYIEFWMVEETDIDAWHHAGNLHLQNLSKIPESTL